MEITRTTRVVLTSTAALVFIAFILTLSPSPKVKGTALSPPGICVYKQFQYRDLRDDVNWKPEDWYIAGLKVDVWYCGCWLYVGQFTTNETGWIEICGVPSGTFKFEWMWNGEPDSEIVSVCCSQKDWHFYNYLEPKGGERAISLYIQLIYPVI